MVQGRLRRVVEQDEGKNVRGGVSKKHWEAVMTAAVNNYPIASIEPGKDMKVVFFAPPSTADGRHRMVYYHSMLMNCCCVTARRFRQMLALDAQQLLQARNANGSRPD